MVDKTIIISLVFVININALGQKNMQFIFYKEIDDFHNLYVFEAERQSSKKFYETPTKFVFYEFKPSPQKNFVALLERNSEHMRPEDLGYALQNLAILDSTGQVLTKVDQVLDFAWSPAGDSLVFIRGRDYGEMELKSEGLWLMELSNSFRETKISDENAAEVNWVSFNGKVYIRWSGIYEVDPTTKLTRKTDFKGMYFSPGGEFYYKPNYEGTGFELYETSSNRVITPNIIDKEKVNFYQWLSNRELVVGDMTFDKQIIDVSAGRVKQSISGQILRFDEKKREIMVRKDRNAFKELSESRFEKINLR